VFGGYHDKMMKRPVTQIALIQRMRRYESRTNGHMFSVTRRTSTSDLGTYHTTSDNCLVQRWDSIDELIGYAREVGVLATYEELAS
jgi:hypothetical protein